MPGSFFLCSALTLQILTELRLCISQSHLGKPRPWHLTWNLEKSYFLSYLVMSNATISLWYSHSFPRSWTLNLLSGPPSPKHKYRRRYLKSRAVTLLMASLWSNSFRFTLFVIYLSSKTQIKDIMYIKWFENSPKRSRFLTSHDLSYQIQNRNSSMWRNCSVSLRLWHAVQKSDEELQFQGETYFLIWRRNRYRHYRARDT